jgi:hypothetical protein
VWLLLQEVLRGTQIMKNVFYYDCEWTVVKMCFEFRLYIWKAALIGWPGF